MSWQTTQVATLKLPSLPFPLEPAGSPPARCRVQHGVLSLTAAANTDLFIDPAGTDLEHPPDAGRFTGLPPTGDFTLTAQVSVKFGHMCDAGVLLVHARERHWAKLCLEYSPQLRPTAVTVVTRGLSDDCNSFEVADLPCGCGSPGPAGRGPSTRRPMGAGGGCCAISRSAGTRPSWSGSASWLSPGR